MNTFGRVLCNLLTNWSLDHNSTSLKKNIPHTIESLKRFLWLCTFSNGFYP